MRVRVEARYANGTGADDQSRGRARRAPTRRGNRFAALLRRFSQASGRNPRPPSPATEHLTTCADAPVPKEHCPAAEPEGGHPGCTAVPVGIQHNVAPGRYADAPVRTPHNVAPARYADVLVRIPHSVASARCADVPVRIWRSSHRRWYANAPVRILHNVARARCADVPVRIPHNVPPARCADVLVRIPHPHHPIHPVK